MAETSMAGLVGSWFIGSGNDDSCCLVASPDEVDAALRGRWDGVGVGEGREESACGVEEADAAVDGLGAAEHNLSIGQTGVEGVGGLSGREVCALLGRLSEKEGEARVVVPDGA